MLGYTWIKLIELVNKINKVKFSTQFCTYLFQNKYMLEGMNYGDLCFTAFYVSDEDINYISIIK